MRLFIMLLKKIVLLFVFFLVSISFYGKELFVTTSDGVQLYVKVKGSGPYCLYIHGGPGSGSYWLEKFSGDFLEQHFTMVYLDQRGVGRSSSPIRSDYSMNRMIADFEKVREVLDIEKWLVMGHSFGGILQMGYVENHSEAIEGLVMINCTLDVNHSIENGWLIKSAELLEEEGEFLQDDSLSKDEKLMMVASKLNEKNIRWKIFYTYQNSEQLMNKSFEEISDFNNDFSDAYLNYKEYSVDYRPKTSKVTKPVLFFYGKYDWSVGPEHYKGIHFPNMLLWGSEVGHVPFLENKEDMQTAILTFIKKWKFN